MYSRNIFSNILKNAFQNAFSDIFLDIFWNILKNALLWDTQNVFTNISPRIYSQKYILENIFLIYPCKYNTFANVFVNILQVLNKRVIRSTLMY